MSSFDHRIRVLRVITRMNVGGPAHHVSVLSGLLDPSRYDTVLVAGQLGRGEASADALAARYGARLEPMASLGREVRPVADVKAFTELVQRVRRFRPDIVHTHLTKAGLLGRFAAACAVKPRPVILHTYEGNVMEGYFSPAMNATFQRLERMAARISDSLVGISQSIVDDLVRLRIAPRSKFRTIPLGLDLEPFLRVDSTSGEAFRREVGVAPGDVLVTFVGRLVPIKRADLALKAVAQGRRVGAPLRLAVVGDGELRPELEQLARQLGLADAVRFVGYRVDMPEIAAATDISVLTSDVEGLGAVLVEAGAAGRPLVATAVGGVPEVVCAGCGVTVAPGDDGALAAALVDLARSPDTRRAMGERARAHVKERFSVQRLLHDVDALYEELLARRERGALAP